MKYDHKQIEKHWQELWEKNKVNVTREKKENPKFYILDMFPYPSGEGLHVGHPKGYIASDIIAKKKVMQGYNVLHPMGWDAFGLPAENYAIKNKLHPQKAMTENIARFKKQLQILGLGYDWSREVNTTDPAYYKWTQWIFLKIFQAGLAYESNEPINWCPSCQTGLANEDLENGLCERCGSVVEKKPLRQWVLKITDYAERLLSDLETLDWPEAIKESQRNWIGKSEGAEIDFEVSLEKEKEPENNKKFTVSIFTTRPDTIFGATYLVLAPEHPLLKELSDLADNSKEILAYRQAAGKKTELERGAENREKTGIAIKGLYALNPATGEKIPVWVADYVLADYGTGAVMAVPAHDERDYYFAVQYNLSIKNVIQPIFIDKNNPPQEGKKTVERKTIHALIRDPENDTWLVLKWKKQPWRGFVVGGVDEGEDLVEAARREVLEETGYEDLLYIKTLGESVRSEYFAAHKDENRLAITSAIYFELQSQHRREVSEEEQAKHEVEWVKLDSLNSDNMTCAELELWKERLSGNFAYTSEGLLINSEQFNGRLSSEIFEEIIKFIGGKLKTRYKLRDWVFSRQRYWGEPIPLIHCAKCGVVGVPEKDLPVTLPEVESYQPTGTGESPLAAIEDWVRTVCPECGGEGRRETNTMPQWAGSSWYYLRYIDPDNEQALVDKTKEKYWSPVDLYIGGAEHATRHLIYARFWHKFLYDQKIVSYPEPFTKYSNLGLILAEDGRKMSKRWGNVINPDEMVEKFGADAFRLYEMFIGPFTKSAGFKVSGVAGARTFLEKVCRLGENLSDQENSLKANSLLHKTILKVGDDIDNLRFNTAVSCLMILVNTLLEEEQVNKIVYEKLLIILAPFAPHLSEELWHKHFNKSEDESIFFKVWPNYDPALIKDEEVMVVVQVNGKVRDRFMIEAETEEEILKTKALSLEKIKNIIEGKKIIKAIIIKNKLVNLVVD